VEVSAGLLALDDRRYILGFVRDATRRKQTETALRDSEALYRGLLGAWPDPTIIYDPTGAVTYVNESFEHTYGFSAGEVLGRRLDMIVPDEETGAAVGTWRQLLETGRAETLEARRKTKDGRFLIVKINVSILRDAKGRHVASLAIHRDVTKQREAEQRNRLLEERSRHSQKIESLGVLAGGIAHDFNNLLTPIIGFTELAIDDVGSAGNTRQNLEHVVAAAERARDLVSQILVFSREDVDEVCPVRLGQTVRETIHLLRASLPATIRIEKEFEECPDVVLANPTQLHQIVMNLATNASHAMGPHGGLLSLCVRSAVARDLERMGFSSGSYVILSVADTGRGISPEIRDRIFDPFFTTKGVGEGTGMGLSMVHGITRQMGGAVVFETEVGKGTRFDVCLPLHSGEVVVGRQEGIEDYPVRSGKILLADDEEMIVDFWKQAFLRMGYVVEAATVAVDALAKFEADPDGFDLVITDQTMPQMTGTEFAKRILEIRPDIPIILCTGYSKTISPEEILAAGIREFLTKPITVQQMAAAIHRVMSGGEATENSAATEPSSN
jgi:PAS domain S-box-containing protein